MSELGAGPIGSRWRLRYYGAGTIFTLVRATKNYVTLESPSGRRTTRTTEGFHDDFYLVLE